MSLILSGSDGLSDVDGSASTPAIRGTDANTGIFFPAADTIAFAEGGTESMRLDSSGNVGIGTTSPSYRLHVSAGGNTIGGYFYTPSGQSGIRIETAGNDKAVVEHYTNGNGNWRIGPGITTAGAYEFNSVTAGATRMLIDSSGNVGIGSSSITRAYANYNQLNINGTSGATIQFLQNGTERGNIVVDANAMYLQSAIAMAFGVGGTGTGTERMRITGGGEVFIAGTTDQGAYNLQCNGTGVWGAGAYVNGSDARIKEDVAPIDSGLDVVEKLNPVTYRYKEDWSKDQSVQTGFIAQELLTALDGKNYVDGIVQQGGAEGYYSVAYQNIIPILTKAIQELKSELDAAKARIAVLEAK